MLVLSRQQQEKIIIGDDIRIVVTRLQSNRVTLGVIAPADVSIRRGELIPREPPTTRRARQPLATAGSHAAHP